ncbi:MAG: Crp/Fnr family transcriptional regulator [Clostridium sp.]
MEKVLNFCCGDCDGNSCARRVSIFESLTDEELREITKQVKRKRYAKNEVIFEEGDEASTLYFVNRGKIKLYKYTCDGKEQILHILSEGDFFGELNLVRNSKDTFNAKALEDCGICTLSKGVIREIILKNPEIGLKMLEGVASRLGKMEELAQTLATNDIDSRIAFLINGLIEKYGEDLGGNIEITLPLSREEMANYIGVTRETISRKLKKLEEIGVIKLIGTKRMSIKDKEYFKTFVG